MSESLIDDYSSQTDIQTRHSFTLPRVKKAIQDMLESHSDRFKDSSNPFVIVELGCGDSSLSIPYYKAIIEVLGRFNPQLPVCLYLNDIVSDGYLKAADDIRKALSGISGNFFVFAAPGSFYDQIFPGNFVDFFLIINSLFYITKDLEVPFGNRLMFTVHDAQSENGKIWLSQTRKDWIKFLSLREKELKKGGRLHVVNDIYSEKSDELSNVFPKKVFQRVLKINKISDQEMNFTFSETLRTTGEYKLPFLNGEIPLKWLWSEEYEVPLGSLVEYRKHKDKTKFGTCYADYIKSWSRRLFEGRAKRKGIKESVINDILEGYYLELAKEFSEKVESFFENDLLIFACIEK